MKELSLSGERPALIAEGGSLSHGELGAIVQHGDLAYGGEVVTVAAERRVAVVVQMLRAWSAGRAFRPLNSRDPRQEGLECGDSNGPGIQIQTSGSSGRAKLISLSLAHILASARSTNEFYHIGPDDSWLMALPLFHVGGLMIPVRTLLAGASAVLADPRALAAAIVKFRPSVVSVVPTQLQDLLGDKRAAEYLRTMKAILCGGAACPPALWQACATLELPVSFTYGMTETCSQIAATVPGDYQNPGEMTVLSHVDVVVEQGRILVRSRTEPGSWFLSSDCGFIDPESGRLRVNGRADQAFKCGGELIQPQEIVTILDNAAIAGCQFTVLPQPDQRLHNVPVLVAWAQECPDTETIIAALGAALVRFKWPRQIYWVRPERPNGGLFKPTANAATEALASAAARCIWEDSSYRSSERPVQ